MLKCHIFDCRCPQLLSRQGLANLKANVNIENNEIYFGAIDQTIHLEQSGNGHFLINFRDVQNIAEMEGENERIPTIFTAVEDIFAFLGEEKDVPFMGGPSQAEPLEGAPTENQAEPLEEAPVKNKTFMGSNATLPIVDVQLSLKGDWEKNWLARQQDGKRDIDKREISTIKNNGIDI